MAHITSRRGTHDNVVTYEFICDTTADMTNIEQQYITLGSVCVVINGNIGNLEVYIANSNKEWVSIGQINGDPSTIEELREMVDAIVESSAAAVEAISSAEEIVEDAQEYAEISEAWAIGKKNGVAVGSSEP